MDAERGHSRVRLTARAPKPEAVAWRRSVRPQQIALQLRADAPAILGGLPASFADEMAPAVGRASSDITIDIAGILKSGAPGNSRTVLSDPNGLAHLTALGVLVATERVLGLDGQAPAAGGLYLPETLVLPDVAIARFEQFGVRIATENKHMQ
jgi:hypothetical protein